MSQKKQIKNILKSGNCIVVGVHETIISTEKVDTPLAKLLLRRCLDACNEMRKIRGVR